MQESLSKSSFFEQSHTFTEDNIFHLLTHWGRVTHICINKLTFIGSDNYLNQCWNIVNCALRNKLQWNFNLNSNIFMQENAFENVVCEMASICLGLNVLTHWGQNKMAAILQKFVPKGHTGNMWALIGLMAWCQAGYKPSSKPMMTNMQDKADTKISPRNSWVPSRSSQRASNVENLSTSLNHH